MFLGTGWDLMTGFSFPARESQASVLKDPGPRSQELGAQGRVDTGGGKSHAARDRKDLDTAVASRVFYSPGPLKGQRAARPPSLMGYQALSIRTIQRCCPVQRSYRALALRA